MIKKRARVSINVRKSNAERKSENPRNLTSKPAQKDLNSQADADNISSLERIAKDQGQLDVAENVSDEKHNGSKPHDKVNANDEESGSDSDELNGEGDEDSEEESDIDTMGNLDGNDGEESDKLVDVTNRKPAQIASDIDHDENCDSEDIQIGEEDDDEQADGNADMDAKDTEESWRQMPFANLKGVGENGVAFDDDDSEAAFETLAISDFPSHTVVEARNDEAALERKLAEITLFTPMVSEQEVLPFRESLCLALPLNSPLSDKLAVDDLEREKIFASSVTTAVHDGLDKLRDAKVKFRRPPDYFAQMVKSDSQMGKVKTRILRQKERIESAQTRRNNRDLKKNKKKARQEQIEKEQEKKRQTREEIEAVHRVRKERLKKRAEGQASGVKNDDDDDFPIEMLSLEQLDENSTFQKHSDIVSGLKKAWKPQSSFRRENTERTGKSYGSFNSRKGGNKSGFRRDDKGKNGVGRRNLKPDGGISKRSKGMKKKRLGKSRRVAKRGGTQK